jgi:hypothetical protein
VIGGADCFAQKQTSCEQTQAAVSSPVILIALQGCCLFCPKFGNDSVARPAIAQKKISAFFWCFRFASVYPLRALALLNIEEGGIRRLLKSLTAFHTRKRLAVYSSVMLEQPFIFGLIIQSLFLDQLVKWQPLVRVVHIL